jgi:xanthine dehydrogenase accessory factor
LRELRDILWSFSQLSPSTTAEARDTESRGSAASVLATVVHAAGSTYRRPGARMLVLPDDEMVGLISGGCLEGDLLEHAREVRVAGRAKLVQYDATDKDDIIWGLGLGCAGVVEVLLEPVSPESPGPLAWLGEWTERRSTGVLATSLGENGLVDHWALQGEGGIEGALDATGAVEARLREALGSGRSGRVATANGDLVIEIVRPPLRLAIFGAGPDVAPVHRLALELGWDVDLADPRPAYADPERFPGARVVCAPAEEAVAALEVDDATYTIVMTHHYLHDRAILADLLPSSTPYVGLLGPKQRALDLLADLAEHGVAFTDDQRARLFAPAGLDLGGEGPGAIALALISEILARSEERSGSWLRERKGPIHDASPG